MAGAEHHKSVKFAEFAEDSEASIQKEKSNIQSKYQQQRLSEDWHFWCCFFGDAGFSAAEVATLAEKFVKNRLRKNMLPFLNREYLLDMDITRVGDIITILKQAKIVHDKAAVDVGGELTADAVETNMDAAEVTSEHSATVQGKNKTIFSPIDFHGVPAAARNLRRVAPESQKLSIASEADTANDQRNRVATETECVPGFLPKALFKPKKELEEPISPRATHRVTRSSTITGNRPNPVVRCKDDPPIGGRGHVRKSVFEADKRTSTPYNKCEAVYKRQERSRSNSLRQPSAAASCKAAVAPAAGAMADGLGCGRSSATGIAKRVTSRSASAAAGACPIVDPGRLASVQTRASLARMNAIHVDSRLGSISGRCR